MDILNYSEYECAVERENGKIHTVYFTMTGETLSEAVTNGSNVIRAHILHNYKPWITVVHTDSNMVSKLDDRTDDYAKFLKFAQKIIKNY